MGQFNGLVVAEFHPPLKWILTKPLSYTNNQVFLMAMLDAEPKVPKWKIYPAYWAVVLFGRWSIIPSKDNV